MSDTTQQTSINSAEIAFELLSTQWIETEASPTYHGWPTLINTGSDKLAVVCSGGRKTHVDPFGKVLMYESCDKGLTWSTPRVLVNGPLDDRDAGILVTPAGTWLVNYFTSLAFVEHCTKETIPADWKAVEDQLTLSTIRTEHGFFMLRSEDQGKSWSGKYPVPVNNVHGPIILQDGSLFFCGRGCSGTCLTGSTFSDEIVSCRSTDDGKTWEKISTYTSSDFENQNLKCWHELHSVQASDGTIITQIRNASSHQSTWQMESKDGGKTWQDLRYICEGFPSHLLKLADNRLLMSYGYRKENSGNRCRISSDNGKSWSKEFIISEGAPSRDLGYPSTAQLSDGTLVTVWYERRSDISVASLRCARWKLK